MGPYKRIRTWKKENYNPWKEESYKPWKEEKYKPWKEKKSKQFKQWKEEKSDSLQKKWHTLKKSYNERRDNKRIGTAINIKNIENAHFGPKTTFQMDYNAPELRKEKLPITRNFQNANQLNYDYKDNLYLMFDNIERFYQLGHVKDVILKCQELIMKIMDKIATMYNFRYIDINQFLSNLSNITPAGKKFIIYDEFYEFSDILDYISRQLNQITFENAQSLFLITKKIIEILKYNWSENTYENFIDLPPDINVVEFH